VIREENGRDREGMTGSVRPRRLGSAAGKLVSAANRNLATGEIELEVLEATVFNKAETPPFAIEDKIDTREEVRLEHRYLDLQRAPLHGQDVREEPALESGRVPGASAAAPTAFAPAVFSVDAHTRAGCRPCSR
jgi:hypothetical protein